MTDRRVAADFADEGDQAPELSRAHRRRPFQTLCISTRERGGFGAISHYIFFETTLCRIDLYDECLDRETVKSLLGSLNQIPARDILGGVRLEWPIGRILGACFRSAGVLLGTKGLENGECSKTRPPCTVTLSASREGR